MSKTLFLSISLCLVLLTSVNTQECPNLADKVTTLPSFDSSLGALPCSYSGYVDISQDDSLFYWFFITTNGQTLASEIPVVVWLQGGPGTSSLYGLFSENGPLTVSRDQTNNLVVKKRPESWIDQAHVLFVDQPVGTGYSFGKNYATTERDVANNFIAFIKKFIELHPETKSLNWYITGESYAGKYVPSITEALLKLPTPLVKVAGAMIGDGLVFPEIQRFSNRELLKGLGIADKNELRQLSTLENNCHNAIKNQVANLTAICDLAEATAIGNLSGGINLYNFNSFTQVSDTVADLDTYLNGNGDPLTIKTDLHITKSTKSPVWSFSSDDVKKNIQKDIYTTSMDSVNYVVNNVRTLFYNGNMDIKDGSFGASRWISQIANGLGLQVTNQTKSLWKVINPSSKIEETVGYFQNAGKITFLTILRSGHMVPLDQLSNSIEMLRVFTGKGDFCNSNNCSVTADASSAMNNCNGAGTFDQTLSKCICNKGYGLEDCSVQAQRINSQVYVLPARNWLYLQAVLNGGEKVIKITHEQNSLASVEIYVSNDRVATDYYFNASNKSPMNKNRQQFAYIKDSDDIYISLRNSNYTSSASFKIDIYDLVEAKDESIFNKGQPGYIAAIILFVFGVILFAAALIICCKSGSGGLGDRYTGI